MKHQRTNTVADDRIMSRSQTLEDFVKEVYAGDVRQCNSNVTILTPKVNDVRKINEMCLNM